LAFYRCAGAGHLREDIVYYSKELNKLPITKDENRSYIMDMGVKALRLVTYNFNPVKTIQPNHEFRFFPYPNK